MKAAPLAILVLLLGAGVASAGWNQAGGGPGRPSYVELPDGPLDVLASGNVLGAGEHLNAGYLATPHVVLAGEQALVLSVPYLGIQSNPQALQTTCRLIRFGEDFVPHEVVSFQCPNGGSLLGYLDGPEVALVAVAGSPLGAPTTIGAPASGAPPPLEVRALRLDGSVDWIWRPLLTGSAPSTTANTYKCPASAFNEARALLLIQCGNDQDSNLLARLDPATGEALWTTSLSGELSTASGQLAQVPSLAPGLPSGSDVDGRLRSAGQGRFIATGMTIVGNDVLVKGGIPSGSGAFAALSWLNVTNGYEVGFLDHGSTAGLVGIDAPTPSVESAANFEFGSEAMASDGTLGAGFLGRFLYFVTPGHITPAALDNFALDADLLLGAPPAWGHDILVAPTQTAAYIVPRGLHKEPGYWGGDSQGKLGAVLIDRDRSAYATVQVFTERLGAEDRLERFSLPDGTTLSHIPLPHTVDQQDAGATGPFSDVPTLLPLPDGKILSVDNFGNVALVGPREAGGPILRLSDDYPRTSGDVRDEVRLDVTPPTDTPVKSVLVGWGDGAVTESPLNASAPPTKRYSDDGDYTIFATLVYADGTTTTSEIPIHPGRTKPNPSLVETLFRPENQNYTFFAIGILVTLITSLVATMGALRGRRRLDKYLQQLANIRDVGRRDAFGAVVALHRFRDARDHDLASGHLDNGQFTILDSQAKTVLELLRQRILGPFVGRLSDPFTHALDTALADGSFDDQEAGDIAAMVDREKDLSGAEKDRLRNLVRSWNAAL